MHVWMFTAWSLPLLVAAGSGLLVLQLRSRGWLAVVHFALVVACSLVCSFACLVVGFFLDILLWGFDIDGKAPPWAKYLIPVVTLVGTVVGIVIGFVVAHRMRLGHFGQDREYAADYGDGQDGMATSPRDR